MIKGIYYILEKAWGEGDPKCAVAYTVGLLLCIIAGYFLGSINSAIVVSRLKYHQDIREYGSKNAGMTNMFRVYGKTGGLLTLAGDFLKTALAVLFADILLGNGNILGSEGAYLAGFFCMLGHIFPIYYKFKGGKGVLVTAVTLLLVEPPVFLLLFVIFAVVLIGSKMVSLASVMSAVMLPVILDSYYKIMVGGNGSAGVIRMMVALMSTLIVVYMHRSNLKRIHQGVESKVTLFKRKKKEEMPAEPECDELEEPTERGDTPNKNTSRKKLKRKK